MIPLYLLVHDPLDGDYVVPVVGGAVSHGATVGRDLTCDVVVRDEEVSRCHATLASDDGGWSLSDNGSTNGTFVNGARLVGSCAVHPGDVVQIGRVTLEIHSREPQLG